MRPVAPVRLILDDVERALLNGEAGAGVATAMELLVAYSDAIGARSLLPIQGAHIDGCLYHGEAGLDFVELLLAQGAKVRTPTTLNVGSIDLIHPEIIRSAPAAQVKPRRLMEAHLALGCVASFTCAPYQTMFRPRFGDQVAWGESNAVVFANSVIGARTNRYGDFLDLCCAVTGRAPAWGLHLDENRLGQVLFRLTGFPASLEATDGMFVAVGLFVGARTGDEVPVIEGLPPPRTEDQLKALGAAAASAGAVGLFHVVGVTPEAATLGDALGGRPPQAVVEVTPNDLREVAARLSTVPDGAALSAVCLGTPHFSEDEWARLSVLVRSLRPARGLPIYVNTGRATLESVERAGVLTSLREAGVIPVVDTCTYVTSILEAFEGAVMTNSGKWAHYAPGNLGCAVAFGDLEDCIASAAAGRVVRAAP